MVYGQKREVYATSGLTEEDREVFESIKGRLFANERLNGFNEEGFACLSSYSGGAPGRILYNEEIGSAVAVELCLGAYTARITIIGGEKRREDTTKKLEDLFGLRFEKGGIFLKKVKSESQPQQPL